MVLLMQNTGQLTELFMHDSIQMLLGVLDPVDATFDILVRPRLQEHGDRQLVRAKQHKKDLKEIILLFAPFTRLYLDPRLFALLETPESYPDLIKFGE